MNPLTNVKNINKLNEIEAELGVAGSKTSWHEQYKDSAYVFVGGLPYDLTEGDIICVFSQYGEIVNINLVRDKKTGKSKGYCFLAYENQRSTILAVDNFNGIKLLGRVLRVDHVGEYRKPKEDENDDEVTKQLRQDGCAPKTPSPSASSDEEEEDYPTPKKKFKKEHKTKSKDKKKKKKKKHKKDNKMSSKSHPGSSDSDESSPSEEHQSPVRLTHIKQEVDRGYRDSEMDNPKKTRVDERDAQGRHMKRDYDDHPQKDERRWRHDDTKQTERRGDSASRWGRESHKDSNRGRVGSPSPNRQGHHQEESRKGDRDRDTKEERGRYEFSREEKYPDRRDSRRPDRREETGEERYKERDRTGERRHESRRTDQEPAAWETYLDKQRGRDKERSREMDAPKNRYGESHRSSIKGKDQDSRHERGADRSGHKMERSDSKEKDYKKRYR